MLGKEGGREGGRGREGESERVPIEVAQAMGTSSSLSCVSSSTSVPPRSNPSGFRPLATCVRARASVSA